MNSKYDIDKMEEECGVFGVYTKDEPSVAAHMYYGLFALQHRGQESAGMSISKAGKIVTHKAMGLVATVFDDRTLETLEGSVAIGHVRYSTCGDSCSNNAQPLEGYSKLGQLAIAHNGTLTNAKVIRELLEETGAVFQSTIDSEVILSLISRKAAKGLEQAIVEAINFIQGAYAVVMTIENKLIGFRDPHGIRPLCLGELSNGGFALSSESCGLDAIGAKFLRDIEPGEMVIIDETGLKSIKFAERAYNSPCSFEYIYFARPDSTMDGISVYEARYQAGRRLWEQQNIEADVVIGVPDSGIPAAIGYSEASGIPYGVGIIKNKYIARTFIVPSQELREKAVAAKLNVLKACVEGKRVVVIDDSLVRGTTSKKLIKQLRDAGAKEIHFKSASPAVRFPCYFGIDTAHRSELIAAQMTVEEIAEQIGADTLDYLSLPNLQKSLCDKKYCLGCFNGVYPIYAPMGE